VLMLWLASSHGLNSLYGLALSFGS